jgi:hypothetical protein
MEVVEEVHLSHSLHLAASLIVVVILPSDIGPTSLSGTGERLRAATVSHGVTHRVSSRR